MAYDNYSEESQQRAKKVLRIANCRGKKPVMRDIKKARDILSGLLIELNASSGRTSISKCTDLLWEVLCDNEK